MAGTVDFLLPDLGEGVHEAELISWKVKAGDVVEEMETLAEMETDKALVEVPSPYAGTIVTLHGEAGAIMHVGKPLVSFENATRSGSPVQAENGDRISAERVESGDEAAERSEISERGEQRLESSAKSDSADSGTVVGTMSNQPTLGGSGKVMATPAVRRLARELGIDVSGVSGTGRGGRITAQDVQNAAESTPAPAAASGSESAPAVATEAASVSEAATRGAADMSQRRASEVTVSVDSAGVAQRVPFRGVRRKIAEALSHSIHTAVHFTVMDTANVTALDKLRRQQSAASGEKLSFLPFVMQAVCRGLKQFKTLNANVDDANAEILIKGVINLGIAVDTDHGLMVPVIPNADRLGIIPLQRDVADVAAKCRARTVGLEQLKGGTFTISNVGSAGGAFATPIINYPEVAILGVGRAREAVLTKDGAIFVGMQMPLSMTCDHRVVDGVVAARFLMYVVQLLEQPEVLLEPVGH
ncbi:MAG: 2-oxo acid dehydrogenase subunit E2 [Planctomycetes bacterium]|nr:2-oxo acid dehydrogenase subunit E2 [Planctomycetota bacterium]